MAVNQVSHFFYPPRWKPRLTSTAACTDEGKPVQIVDDIRRDCSDDHVVLKENLKAWLLDRGFRSASSGEDMVFEQNQTRSRRCVVGSLFLGTVHLPSTTGPSSLTSYVVSTCCVSATTKRHNAVAKSSYLRFDGIAITSTLRCRTDTNELHVLRDYLLPDFSRLLRLPPV
jgi:hypothetical protein